jgi:predicted nucleic acid-binding protein
MLLVDTSVWIEHFRKTQSGLAERLSEGLVLMHPFVSAGFRAPVALWTVDIR